MSDRRVPTICAVSVCIRRVVALRLVESRREGGQTSLDVGLQLLAQLGGPLLHRLGHLVEVGDHPGRLLVEAAQVGVERFDPADEAGLVVADLLQDRTCDVLHHAGQVGVHVVEAARRARLRFAEPSVDGLAHRVLELLVASVRLLDGGRQRLQLLAEGLDA